MGLSTMWYFITVRTTACVVATHSISYWPQPFEATEHLDWFCQKPNTWTTSGVPPCIQKLVLIGSRGRSGWTPKMTQWIKIFAPNLVRRYHGHTAMTTLSKKICSIPAFGTGILWSVFKLNWIIYGGVMGEKRFWYFLVLDLHLWPWARCSGVTEGPPMNMWSKLDHFQQSCGQISKQWHGALGHMHHTIPYHTIPYHPGRCGLDLLRTSSAGMGRKEG